MEVAFDATFDEQRKRFSFCFTCEHCAHFDTDSGECLHGFPNHMHRLSYYEHTPPPRTILFCKDFDLG
jgi:hypothetical protein